jgi:hypothetical protein
MVVRARGRRQEVYSRRAFLLDGSSATALSAGRVDDGLVDASQQLEP